MEIEVPFLPGVIPAGGAGGRPPRNAVGTRDPDPLRDDACTQRLDTGNPSKPLGFGHVAIHVRHQAH